MLAYIGYDSLCSHRIIFSILIYQRKENAAQSFEVEFIQDALIVSEYMGYRKH